mgnify:CR=1 FL=1
MERLQAAIEKARAQRESGVRRGKTLFPGPAAAKRPEKSDEAWAALAEIQLRPRVLRRNRVVAYEGGLDSAPHDMLRTRMLHQARTNRWRRIAIVSPDSGCGKSTTAANLAFGMGRQQDLRTMLLDLDLRRGGLARILGQRPKSSMAEVLEGRISFAEHGLRHGGTVAFGLGRGRTRNPSELLQSRQAIETLAAIEDLYKPDILLFDLPPLMASDDNFGFLSNVDAALVVAAADRTNLDRVDVAERQISELTNIMGIVLNMTRFTDGAYGYDYDYYG